MSLFQEIRSVSPDLADSDLLRFLIRDRFPGKTVVTASLRAPSVVVLKMVADIDAACPVVFCHPGHLFPESLAYRERIVKRLGLTNVSVSKGGEAEVTPNDQDHYEKMWAECQDGAGRVFEIVHLNETLAPYDCWISAVFHVPRPPEIRRRVDVDGRLIRIDPLVRWSKDDVRAFMREHELPFHPRAIKRKPAPPSEARPVSTSYHY